MSISSNLVGFVPARYALKHRVLPLEADDARLLVGHVSAAVDDVLAELAFMTGLEVEGRVLQAEELETGLLSLYGVGADSLDSGHAPAATVGPAVEVSASASTATADSAVATFVQQLLRQAQLDGATDIHIEPFENRTRIRIRIDGVLHEVPTPASLADQHAAIVSRIKVLARLDIAEHRLPQDGRFAAQVGPESLDYRVSVLPTQFGETVDLRVLSNAAIAYDLGRLGFTEEELAVVHRALANPHGVILVTGPTGSGKTTTLYSFLTLLNEPSRKILTIEDPIESNLDGVTQMQVHPHIGFTFARGLRSMLRHDPDVMMVGEIRDQETAETAIRVALTGHLVFSTLHTNDAPSTPTRLLDMGIEPYLVASSVECILAQRLVRRVCTHCQESVDLPSAEALGLGHAGAEHVLNGGNSSFVHGAGCDHCHGTGYRGRIAIFEILPVGEQVESEIMRKATAADVRRAARDQGYVPLRWRGLRLAADGVTTIDEVLRVTAASSF